MTQNKRAWLLALAQVPIYFVLIVVVHAFTGPRHGLLASFGLTEWTYRVADAAIYLAAILLTTAIVCRVLNRSSLGSLGLSRQGTSTTLGGLALGASLMVLIFVVSLAMGWVSIVGFAWTAATLGDMTTSLIAFVALQVAIGVNEEVIFRGYVLQRLMDGFGFKAAALLSSLLFAAVHVTNPNASVWSALPLVMPGLLLAAQYRLTRLLWMPIGFHFAWNAAEGLVGFPLSGVSDFSLIKISISGPEQFVGNGFGPEGAWLGVLASLLGFLILYFWSQAKPSKMVEPDLSRTQKGGAFQ